MSTFNQYEDLPPDWPSPPIREANIPAQEQGWIDRFKARVAEFQDLYVRMRGIESNIAAIPELKPQYDSLMARGATIQGTIDTVTNAINSAVQWFKSAFGMEGLNQAKHRAADNLGALQFLPIAAISGALALIGSWVTDTLQFYKRVELYDNLRAEGKSAGEAGQIVAGLTTEPGFFDVNVQKMIVPLVIVAGLWWLMRGKGL